MEFSDPNMTCAMAGPPLLQRLVSE
jgi:hypothetical protein